MKKLCAWLLAGVMVIGMGIPVYAEEKSEEKTRDDTEQNLTVEEENRQENEMIPEDQEADRQKEEKTETQETKETEAKTETQETKETEVKTETQETKETETKTETEQPKKTEVKTEEKEADVVRDEPAAETENRNGEEAAPEKEQEETGNNQESDTTESLYELILDPVEVTLKEGETRILKVSVSMPRIRTDLVCSYQLESDGAIAFDETTHTITALGAGTGYIHVTADWTEDGQPITLNKSCKVTVEKADTDSVILINGKEYAAEDSAGKSNLQQAVEASGCDIGEVTEIEFRAGAIRQDDFAYIAKNADALQYSLKKFVIGDDVRTAGIPDSAIPDGAFCTKAGYCALTDVYLGAGIRGLGQNAFGGCASILNFEAPGVEYIKAGALDSVKAQTLSFPGVTRVEAGAFGTTAKPAAELHLPALQTMDNGALECFENLKVLELAAVPPEMPGELKLAPEVAENLKLELPAGAVKYYEQSGYYDAETNTWCRIALPEQEAGEYTITLIADGQTIDVIILPHTEECLGKPIPDAPDREGYIFLEWNTKADGSGQTVNKDTRITGDLSLYAIYREEDVYTVTFMVDDEAVLVKYVRETDNLLTLPKNPTKTGYTFKRWEGVIDGGIYSVTEPIEIHDDLTLYAVFEKNAAVTEKEEEKKTEPEKETDQTRKEEKKTDKKDKDKKENKKDEKKADTTKKAVKTGDGNEAAPVILTMVLAWSVAGVVIVIRRRNLRGRL